MLLVCLRSIGGPEAVDTVRNAAVLEAEVGGEGRCYVVRGQTGHGEEAGL